MKQKWTAALLAALMMASLCACASQGEDGETVTVQSVAEIVAGGSVGVVDRYAGMVVSGETAKVQKDENKSVQDVLVEEGDWVAAGDVLFTYDTQAMEFELEKLQLELEGFSNSISAAYAEIAELESQRLNASSSQQLAYTLQIQTAQADIREAEYNKALKEREISNMQASMASTDVKAPIAGRIMSVTETEDNGDMMYYPGESDSSFITIMDMQTYRVEGNVNEMNAATITEGMNVLIRSRMDENQTWTGSIEKIDWENPVQGNDDGMIYMGETDTMTQSSKYPFYVALDSKDGLILGQHVYIEPDYGQTEAKTGLWLPGYYLGALGGDAWVWAADSKDRLEKRDVILGEYDFDMDEYQVLSGLSETDYIAFPDPALEAGMAVSYYEEEDAGMEAMVSEVFVEG